MFLVMNAIRIFPTIANRVYQGGEEDLKVGVRYPILSVTPIRFAVISCTRILVGRVRDFSAVFFAIGTVISTYIDNTKTALIVAKDCD